MKYFFLTILVFFSSLVFGQSVPGKEELIDFLVTFGKDAPTSWGDDDHVQIHFFKIPEDISGPFYIRVFDPEIGGKHDEARGDFNTKVKFSIYGGREVFTHPDAKEIEPKGNYKSGTLLYSKIFGMSEKYDDEWYVFGPFNPEEGELFNGDWYFKIIAEGVSGDDGNLFSYFFSVDQNDNTPIEKGKSFTFEYTVRLPEGKCHIYPYIDNNVTAVQIHNFDFDDAGYMKLVSVVKRYESVESSGDGDWVISTHPIQEEEKERVLDVQIINLSKQRNNNVTFYLKNQYGEAMPFLNVPIGLPKIKIIIGPE